MVAGSSPASLPNKSQIIKVMETIEILQRYRDNSTNSSFDLTLRVIEDVLNQRLSPDYRRIRVQG